MSLNLDSLKRFIDAKRDEPTSGFQTPPSSPPGTPPADGHGLTYKDRLFFAYDSLTWPAGLEHAVIGSGAIFLHALRLGFPEEDILHQLNPDDLDILYHNPKNPDQPVSPAERSFLESNFYRPPQTIPKNFRRLFSTQHTVYGPNRKIIMKIDFADANSLEVSELMQGEFPDVVHFEDTDNRELKIPVMNLKTLRAIYNKQNTIHARSRLRYIDQISMPPIPVNI